MKSPKSKYIYTINGIVDLKQRADVVLTAFKIAAFGAIAAAP